MELTGGPAGAPAELTVPARGLIMVKADRKYLQNLLHIMSAILSPGADSAAQG